MSSSLSWSMFFVFGSTTAAISGGAVDGGSGGSYLNAPQAPGEPVVPPLPPTAATVHPAAPPAAEVVVALSAGTVVY